MKIQSITKIGTVYIFLIVLTSNCWAQEDKAKRPEPKRAPEIKEIAYISSEGDSIVTALGKKARIIKPDSVKRFVIKKDKIYFNEVLSIEKNITVKLRVKQPDKTAIWLFLSKPKEKELPKIEFRDTQYQIVEDTLRGPGYAALKIIKGLAIAQVEKKKLTVFDVAGRIIAEISRGSDTEAIIVAHPDTNFIFLVKGSEKSIIFQDTTVRMQVEQIASYRDGEIIKISTPDPTTREILKKLARNYTVGLFPNLLQRLWRKKGVKEAAVAGAAAGAVAAFVTSGKKNLPGPPGVPQKNN